VSRTQSATMTGAERLVEALERLGVEMAFGLPGVHNLPIWKAVSNSTIRLIGVRHEQTAVYAADGYARATGRLGVALVTTGPGAANTLAAAGEAMASGSPVLVIATDIPASLRRAGVYRGVLHETRDQGAMFKPVTKQARTVTSAEAIQTAVTECGTAATEAPSGPVYLGVPTDFLRQPVTDVAAPTSLRPDTAPANPSSLAEAIDILSGARSPVIWAGGGALRADAGAAVGALAERLAAPVITTFMGRGLLPPHHPCAVPGPVQAPEVGALWDAADVVLAIGTDFDGMMTQNWLMPAPDRLISINVDAADANKNYVSDVTLIGDAAELALELVVGLRQRGSVSELAERLQTIGEAVRASVVADEPQAAQFLDVMERVLPDDAVVVADMCIPGYWLGGYRQVPLPRKLAYPLGWGTLGFGFPASLGAALAGVGPAVCVTGDGGFLYACGELATAMEHQVPVTIVLVDDGGYGMLRFDQLQAGDESFGVDLVRPDFVALARSFGMPVISVTGFGEDFERGLLDAIDARAPRMLVVDASLKPPPTTSPRWYRR
jgi:thiamine pyrophosphate-dependent acetolactate synthase large subunit-like protein